MTDLQHPAPARPSSGPPLRALVVDDEHHISDLLATALRYEGSSQRSANVAVLPSTWR